MTENTSRLSTALADRYTIERRLGEGGMATVYLAEDIKHKRKVAVKVLRPELAAVLGGERFIQEITTTANLQHPHILPLFDSGEADSFLYYVMPFIDGETLRDKLDRETQLGVDEAVKIATEIADALNYAHEQGVIHRDIKPENILLANGRPMVADFGIALAVSAAAGGRMTETGLSLGTPHYMSPEQATAEKELTNRADIYSLGSVLYEMLTGNPPHVGATAQQIIMKIVTDDARPVTELRKSVPPNVAAVVAKAIEKLPADRFETAGAFAEALATPDFAIPTTGALGAQSRIPGPRGRGRPTALAVMFTLVGAALTWGITTMRRVDPQPSWQYISLGDSLDLQMLFPAMALSPDGSDLVFKTTEVNSLLWLKRRGQLQATPISGTIRSNNPVFSPDGEWVAFVADGHLKKVRTTGGAAVTLADTVAGIYGGAAWLDDGTLIYVVPALNELRRVSASGGQSTVALRDSNLVGGGIGYPVALPDARGVLFQYCASSCVRLSIHVLDLETGRQKTLLDDVVQASYLPNGNLIYVRRDGVMLAAPFDLDALEITGEAVPVLEGLDAQTGNGFVPMAWSVAGNGELFYVERRGIVTGNTMARVSRDGLAVPIDTSWEGEFNSSSLSPDGRYLAVGYGIGAGLNIWIKQLDRGPFTRLTFGDSDRRPTWSPDGLSVAFIRDTIGNSVVYSKPIDGSGPERFLASLDRQIQEVVWSADGQWLLLRTDNGAAGAGDIVGIRTSGDTTAVSLVDSPFSELHPAPSPDGRWLAYTTNETGIGEVYVRPFPNTRAGRWQVSNGGGTEPVWSADGSEIFYAGPSGQLMAAQVTAGDNFMVTELRPLFDASSFTFDGFHQSYSVTPDGQHFIFQSPRSAGRLQSGPQLVRVSHWFTDLERRMGK